MARPGRIGCGVIEQIVLRDLGVIAEATLPLGPGFTAITGETGAGKTMVVTALGLLLGARSDAAIVRAGARQAVVDGAWLIPERGPVAERVEESGGDIEPVGDGRAELLLGRSVSAEGRSRATVGGRSAPAGVLADLADELVVVHGQSEQLRLRSRSAQRDALDRFGGEAVATCRASFEAAHARWRALAEELEELTTQRDAREDEARNLRAALAEIEQLAPQPGEDLTLAEQSERLTHAEQLRAAAASAHTVLSSDDDVPDVATLVAHARRELERAASTDPRLGELAALLEEIGYRVEDAAASLGSYLADLDDAGPHELALVQERRAALGALVRAHGSVDEALAFAERGAIRLGELDDDPERLERLSLEVEEAWTALDAAADALTAARRAAATRLGDAVTAELRELALPDARLEVEIRESALSASGRDEVELLLAPHPGAALRPVARSASGGELSRVMLAIEVVIAQTDPVPTFVFDEVDAGIGGAAAIEVGRRLARLAQNSQVIAVTHLAQVAAFATNHLSVVKGTDGSVTASSIRQLRGDDREEEVARLLSGMADSAVAREHARALLALGT